MRDPVRSVTCLFLGIVVAAAAACTAGDVSSGPSGGTEPPSGPPEVPAGTVTGTWTLKSVNKKPMPALLWDDHTADGFGAQMYIMSGSIVLRSDSTFSSHEISKLTIEGVGDQVSHSFSDGRWMFYYGNKEVDCYPPDCGWFGDVRLTLKDGRTGTLHFTNGVLASKSMIPGEPGQPDIEVFKEYEK